MSIEYDLMFTLERDCNECISEFDENGGCDCVLDETCDWKPLVPKGCLHCEEEGGEYCKNKGTFQRSYLCLLQ